MLFSLKTTFKPHLKCHFLWEVFIIPPLQLLLYLERHTHMNTHTQFSGFFLAPRHCCVSFCEIGLPPQGPQPRPSEDRMNLCGSTACPVWWERAQRISHTSLVLFQVRQEFSRWVGENMLCQNMGETGLQAALGLKMGPGTWPQTGKIPGIWKRASPWKEE